jgi:hypothetical protein
MLRLSRLRRVAFAAAATCLTLALMSTPAAHAVQTAQPVVVGSDPVDWTPMIQDGQVNAILQVGTKVVVGGTFTQVRRANTQAILTRNYLFAFDMNTGVIDPNFVPVLDRSVEALALGPDGTSVFVGGDFSTVNGQSYKKLVRLRIADGGIVTSFKANASALVQDLVARGPWLYVSGKFTTIKSTARSGLARLDPTTGNVDANLNLPFTDPLRGSLGVPEIDVTPDGTKLIAIGSFSKVAGLDRIQIAMLDVGATPAVVSTWQTSDYPIYVPNTTTTWCSSSFSTYMRDIDIAPDGSYFVVATTGAFRAGRLCDSATRWEVGPTGPNQHPTWIDWSGGDTSWSISATGTAVYVGGHFRWWNNSYSADAAGPGAVAREGIVALDPINGLPFSWNPSHERGVGIFTLPATADGLWAGSDTDHAGNEYHQKIAFFPASGGFAPPPVVTYSLPNDLYDLNTTTGSLERRSYDLTTFGSTSQVTTGVDWRNARGSFMVSGKLYTGWSDATFTVRDFDGTTMGAPSVINLNGLGTQPPSSFLIPGTTTRVPAFTTDLQNMTGAFYSNGRMYYTVNRPGGGSTNLANNNKLYYRYFTPESQVVGASLFVASSYPADTTIQWANVRGMTLANDRLIYATTDNRLWRVNWSGTGPVGTPTQIGGPGIDTVAWASRGLFVFNQVVDTFAPTVPQAPTGSSSTFDSIDLTWPATKDNRAGDLTYHVFRDGSEVGQVVGGQTGTLAFTDTGLAAGSSHTYRIAAQDAAGNQSAQGASSATIVVLAPDLTPPTDPGIPTGVSGSTASISLSWAASSDAVSSTLTYHIYRDAPDQLVGTVVSNSTGTVDFTDTGLWPASTHEYWVEALDEAGNLSGQAHSDPIQVTPAAFADDFAGGLAAWTNVTRVTADVASGSAAAPSAIGNPTAQSAFAYVDLASPLTSACVSANVNVSARSGITLDLLRLRTSAGGAIAKVYLDAQGRLLVRSEFAGTQLSSGIVLPTGWNRLELCGTVGTLNGWDLYLNGSRIVNAWQANTGTTPIGRLQIGDTAAKTWTANWDDVIVDTAAG